MAILGTAAVLLLQWQIDRWLGPEVPLLLGVIPVLLAAWAGGPRAGLLATLLAGGGGVLLLVHPSYAGEMALLERGVWTTVFVLIGGLTCALSRSLRSAAHAAVSSQARAHEARLEVERQATAQSIMERRWMQLLRANVVGTAVGDEHGNVLDANDMLLDMLGYTRADLEAGRVSWRAMTPPDQMSVTEQALREIQAHGVSRTYEKAYLSRAGERIPVLMRVVQAPDDPRHLISFVVDLRRQREAEGALRRNEARLRRLMDAVPEYAFITLDTDGRIASWSAGAEHIYGYTEAEVLRQSLSRLYPSGHDEEQAARELRQALEQHGVEHEGWRVRKDGTRFWANVIMAPLDDGGTPMGYVKITRDLSGRRRSEALLQSLLDNVLDAIIGIDDRGTIQSFNRAAERTFGYTEAEVRGSNVNMLMPEPDHSAHDRYLHNYLATGTAKIIGIGRQVTARRRDGSTFPADLGVSEFMLDGRRFFTGVIRDVTAQRRLEDQLRQASKMEAVGRLAGGVAHDFNNLLTVISGYTAFLSQDLGPGGEAHEMIVAIGEAGEQAARLTRQLLAFSRQAVLEPRVINLNEMVRETEKMLRRMIGEDVRLTTLLAPDTPSVLADPGQVSQILMNLAVNARDAMPRGGQLTVQTQRAVLTGERVRLLGDVAPGLFAQVSVSDSGEGMTEQVRMRAFEPFFTTKPPGEGTGLGLATVYGIVKQSGGHIDLYSEPGVGTTVRIYLPAVGGAGRQEAGDETPVPGGTETILLVEDEPSVREVARMSLATLGYEVLTAGGGDHALRVLEARDGGVDLLLTDVVMPGMSGRELTERVRARYPAVRVLYVSGYTDDAVVRHGLLHAEVAFLQKPYTPRSLGFCVRRVLDAPA